MIAAATQNQSSAKRAALALRAYTKRMPRIIAQLCAVGASSTLSSKHNNRRFQTMQTAPMHEQHPQCALASTVYIYRVKRTSKEELGVYTRFHKRAQLFRKAPVNSLSVY